MKYSKLINYIKYLGVKRFLYKVINKIEQKRIEKNYYTKNMKTKEDYRCQETQARISIIVPIYNTPKKYLIEMIESVIAQIYDNWELCLIDAGSSKENKEIIIDYCAVDQRIVYKELLKNEGIALNTNYGIDIATGDYITFLDHDDLLTRDALYEVNEVIQRSNPDIIYSDEDKINEQGTRVFCPHIKSVWAPTTLRSYNYICHLFVLKRDMIDKYGNIEKGFEGSQDFEFITRMCSKTNKIIHIPKILYHWRINENSTAGDIFNKQYALESGKKVVTQYYKQKKANVIVSNSNYIGAYNVRLKEKYKSTVNVLIYGSSNQFKTFKYDNLNKYNIKYILYDTERETYTDLKGDSISKSEIEIRLKQSCYTLVCNNGISILDDNILENLIPPLLDEEVVVSAPIILKGCNRIMSMGLYIKDKEVNRLYSNQHILLPGYMGRLQISQNVFSVEPLMFLCKTDFFIEQIKGKYVDIEEWIELSTQLYSEKKYFSVNPNSKVKLVGKYKLKRVFTSLNKDKYIRFLEQ